MKGKCHGNGKEYNKEGEIVFEGEYFNGMRWNGKGKEYDDNDKLIFEGEYKKGERDGKGKEYDDNGKLILFERETSWKW